MSQAVTQTGSDVLDKIMQHKAEEVAYAKSKMAFNEVRNRAQDMPPCLGFSAALLEANRQSKAAVIAEIKKASPSKGVIRDPFDPLAIADSYSEHGASCLSILTDEHFFKGHSDYLVQVRQRVALPILRKDFMLDEYQIHEARMIGADCILLIVAALENSLMQDLAGVASELGLDVLVEVHNRTELERGLELSLPMIGINNRNLRNFETSLNTTIELLDDIPNDVLVVTESGIHTQKDVALMREHDVNAFLVGEAFMRADNPGEKMAELFF